MAGYVATLSDIPFILTATLEKVLLLALLLLAEPRQVIFDEAVLMTRGSSQALTVAALQRPTRIICTFQSPGRVRVSLVSVENRTVVAQSGYGASGEVSYQTGEPGHYDVILEKDPDSAEQAIPKLKVELVYSDLDTFEPRTISSERRMAVIAIALTVFACICLWSGRKIRQVIRDQANNAATGI